LFSVAFSPRTVTNVQSPVITILRSHSVCARALRWRKRPTRTKPTPTADFIAAAGDGCESAVMSAKDITRNFASPDY
jgi:hypothetical protein